MKIEDLRSATIECREYIQNSPPSSFGWKSSLGSGRFPKGCCGDASRLLARFLCDRFGISVYYVSGINGGYRKEIGNHAWLEFEGSVLDITSDQFNDSGYSNPDVYVGCKSNWYQTFELNESQSCELKCQS